MSDEGEDPSPQPKRKIKKVMVLSSASSSDSDDSQPAVSTRRKRLRVVSDDGSDSSSGSWAIVGALRRRRALPGLRDSFDESDSSGWATDHSDVPATSSAPVPSSSKLPASKAQKAVSGFSSDSSEGNSEKCSICLMKFLNQEVGTPQNCEHIFCLDCIMEWSRNMNTCPVDRITFDSIVVRACVGGRVLRTEPVKVLERRPSVEMMLIEDPTVCEVCHNADREESMLLCDGCDLGFHMQCLTPPLTRIPEDQWLCPNCAGVWRSSPIFFPMQSSHSINSSNIRERLVFERTRREGRDDAEPSTSSGRRGGAPAQAQASASVSRTSRPLRGGATGSARRTTTPRTRKRKYKRRKTRTVIVEYEVQGEGKFPITKTRKVKTKIKKRKPKKRTPRTAARRTHVLASVRAKLAAVRSEPGGGGSVSRGARAGELAVRRADAGIAPLSLFGSAHHLDFFEEEDEQGSEGASTAVAARPTASVFSAYRQARRKMIAIPSPPHASAAPDLLSDILERQTLLHSKHSIVSVTLEGDLDIKLQTHHRRNKEQGRNELPKRENPPLTDTKEVDLRKGGEGTRQAPAYPGQGRGWGGGYRYPREQNQNQNQANQGYARGGYDNGYGPQRGPAGGSAGPGPYTHRRDDNNGQLNDYNNRRSHHYAGDDEPWHDRNRRQHPEHHRGANNQRHEDRRFSSGPAWQQQRRAEPPALRGRQSFGGFDNPLDMRVGQEPLDSYSEDTRDKPQAYRPLPEPPVFEMDAALPPLDRDEDERSDEGLVIDTEKYDPTEPTHDDDSGEEGDTPAPPSPPPPPAEPEPAPAPPPAPSVESILAGLDTRGMDVPPDVLDSAVRAALQSHRALLAPGGAILPREGDCPNFSIYSATSVHIANDSCSLVVDKPLPRRNSLEDLVQEDGDLTPPDPPPPDPPSVAQHGTSEEEYKAKVSKRCPITTNTRNPIKIKLITPSLIKRQVSLYDDEDVAEESEQSAEPAAPQHWDSTSELRSAVGDEKVHSDLETERKMSTEENEDPKDDATSTSRISDEDATSKKSDEEATPKRSEEHATPKRSEEHATPKRSDEEKDKEDKEVDDDRTDEELADKEKAKSDSEDDVSSRSGSPRSPRSPGAPKMTESISETEDERSYTPCLDENKSKDASLEDKGIEGLDTEMISEEEGNDMFSESSPHAAGAPPPEEGEILDKKPKNEEGKKKKKKESKKEKEGKSKGRKRNDEVFKKLGKGKERNYREREKEKEKRRSPASSRERRRRKDKRKDLERYDVRTLVSERRRRTKDAFGRDVSPSHSHSPTPPPLRRAASSSVSPRRARFSPSPVRRRTSPSPRRARISPSPARRRTSPSPRRARISPSPVRRRTSPSPRRARISPSPARRRTSPSPRRARISSSPMRRRTSLSPRRARISPSPVRRRTSPSPRRARISPSSVRRRTSPSPRRARISPSPVRRRTSPSPRRARISSSPVRRRTSPSPRRTRISPSPVRRRTSPSPRRVRISPSPVRRRTSPSPRRVKISPSPVRRRTSPSPRRARISPSPRRPRLATPSPPARRSPSPKRRRKRSGSRGKVAAPRRRASAARARKRRRSASPAAASPKPGKTKKKKRARSPAPASASGGRRRKRARSPAPAVAWSPPPPIERAPSPRTPPPAAPLTLEERRRRREVERAHRRIREATGPSKEVFTSGDNILVSVSFKEQEVAEGIGRRSRRKERRRRRRRAALEPEAGVQPVAIIDLERSPFRELTPDPKNVIVLSDDDAAPPPAAPPDPDSVPAPSQAQQGPKTPPEPEEPPPKGPAPAPEDQSEAECVGPLTPPEPPESPDAYDPYEPTRSASNSPQAGPPSQPEVAAPSQPDPEPATMTLETAQKTNLSADEVLDRRPLSPIEKVMALLQSTRDVSPEEPEPRAAGASPGGLHGAPPGADAPPSTAAVLPAPRILLSDQPRPPPKLFLAKPSPIKSDPIKPMPQATKISRLPLPMVVAGVRRVSVSPAGGGASPYSPGSSDFGDLFEPPPPARQDHFDALIDKPARMRSRRNGKSKRTRKGKTTVDVKLGEDNLKILDELPSSAVEMQVKSKVSNFLKKLNRQERVVEEVKLVLKPHYNKKHVSKEEYKHILRRAVPKICHNKTGEINPTKIQALVEAYVKKFRKKRKLGQ